MADDHQMSKFDLDLMAEQVRTFLKVVLLLDEMPTADIGKPEPYTFLWGSLGKRLSEGKA